MTLARLVIRIASSPWFRVTALAGVMMLAIVSLYPSNGTLPRTRLPGPVEHFIAYAVVAALAAFAFRGKLRIWLLAVLMITYAAILETAQRWAPGRSASVVDFIGSSTGVIVGIGLCALFLRALDRLADIRG
jgi:VanZ family protein